MAAYILMLGSAMAVAAAGQFSVKEEDPPPSSDQKKKSSSSFWSEEVMRLKQDEKTVVDGDSNYVEDCKGFWSPWSACDEECDGGDRKSVV